MKILKKPLMLSVIATLLLATMAIGPVSAQGTLSVNPSIASSQLAFTITVDVDDGVTNLWGYEFKLWYDTNVLTATKSTPSTDFPDISRNEIDDEAYPTYEVGYVWVAASLPMVATGGLNGPRTLVTIEFRVDALGESTLDIDEDSVILISAAGGAITPTIEDGYGYFGPIPRASLWAKVVNVKKRYMDVSTIQTIKGLITNKGEEGVYVRAKFVIVEEFTPVAVATSDVLWIDHGADVWVTAEWHAEDPGSYWVKGDIEFSTDGINWANYGPYKEMLGGQESFRVVGPSWFKVA